MAFRTWDEGTRQLPAQNWDLVIGIIAEKIPELKPHVQEMSGWNYQVTDLLREARTLLGTGGGDAAPHTEEVFALSATETLAEDQRADNGWGLGEVGTVGETEWVSQQPEPTDDKPYVLWAIRAYMGMPEADAAIADTWSAPIVIRRPDVSTTAGTGFEIIFTYTVVDVPPAGPITTVLDDQTDNYLPDGWAYLAPLPSPDRPFTWHTYRTGSSLNWSKFGPVRSWIPASAPDPDLYPFSHALPFDLRRTVFGAAVDPGEWVLRDVNEDALSGGNDEIQIRWDEVVDAASYEIRFREEGAASWGNWVAHTGSERMQVFGSSDGIRPGHTYEFQVRAIAVNDVPGLPSDTVSHDL